MFIVAIHYCIKGLFTLRACSPVLKLIRHLIVKGKVSENQNKAPFCSCKVSNVLQIKLGLKCLEIENEIHFSFISQHVEIFLFKVVKYLRRKQILSFTV